MTDARKMTLVGGRTGIGLGLLCLVATGCGQAPPEVADVQTRLSRLGILYGMYIGGHSGQTPQSLESFKQYVQSKTTPEQLERLGVQSADELFVSPRDGQPLKMVSYKKPPPPPVGEPPPVVFYEAEGKEGEWAVGLLGGGTLFVDREQLREMLPDEGA